MKLTIDSEIPSTMPSAAGPCPIAAINRGRTGYAISEQTSAKKLIQPSCQTAFGSFDAAFSFCMVGGCNTCLPFCTKADAKGLKSGGESVLRGGDPAGRARRGDLE